MDHQQPKPPPPQAGKFKPRKPAKKINVGGIPPPVVPDAVTSASSTAQRRSSQGRGGRGGGRGTGRGSRAPIPQGKAFFTAQPAPVSNRGNNQRASHEPSTVTSDATVNQAPPAVLTLQQQRQARRKRDDNVTGIDEEIVGTLDEAVGYSLNVDSQNKLDRSGSHSENHKNTSTTGDGSTATTNLERALLGKAAASQPYLGPNGYIYDSDSSDDENDHDNVESDDAMVQNVGVQRPLTLPFPASKVMASHSNVALDTNEAAPVSATKESKSQFPFLNTDVDAYFLVQLPTRLPPVIPSNDSIASNSMNNHGSNDSMAVHSDPDVRIVEPIAVATPPIESNAFDNVLANAKPGRIGKLKIYRSGRTVLVIDSSTSSDDISAPIIMNVSEGLRCEFQQQAVSINLDQQTYTPFGHVNGTMVVTPDF